MEPEDIIQQKEWLQLDDAEKYILHDIAGTEHEFNLMKKILSVSKEELEEVPEADPAILQTLQTQLQTRSKRKSLYILYAAAAVMVILLTLFIVLKKEDSPERNFVQEENNIPGKKQDTIYQPIVTEELVKDETDAIVKNTSINKIIQRKYTSVVNDNDVAVNTTIASNTALLDYVTELN